MLWLYLLLNQFLHGKYLMVDFPPKLLRLKAICCLESFTSQDAFKKA